MNTSDIANTTETSDIAKTMNTSRYPFCRKVCRATRRTINVIVGVALILLGLWVSGSMFLTRPLDEALVSLIFLTPCVSLGLISIKS